MDAPFGHICRVSVYFESNRTKYLAAFKIAIAFSSLTNPVSVSCWQPKVTRDGGLRTVSGVQNC